MNIDHVRPMQVRLTRAVAAVGETTTPSIAPAIPGVARLRAEENARTDRLVTDPYAAQILAAAAAAGSQWAAVSPQAGLDFFALMADQVAVRTRPLDQTLLALTRAGCAQVVLLACGMDTRAFRLDWPAGTQGKGQLGLWLVAPVAAMFLAQVLFYVIPTQIPGLLAEGFDAGPFQTSIALSFMTLTVLPVSLLYPRLSKHASAPGLIAVAFTAPVAGFAVLATADSMWIVVAGLMITAAGLALAGPSLNNWIIAGGGDAVRGRAVGMLTTGLFAGQFFSPVLTQPIIDVAGLRLAFLGIAGASALTALGYTTLSRRSAQS